MGATRVPLEGEAGHGVGLQLSEARWKKCLGPLTNSLDPHQSHWKGGWRGGQSEASCL